MDSQSAASGPGEQTAAEARIAQVQNAVDVWVQKLTDMSGNNQLLYFRARKNTLLLHDADPAALRRLLDGKTVNVSDLFVDTDEDPDRTDLATRQAKALHRRTRTHFEERGIDTLWMALGMATWSTSTSLATPHAPVLLRPAKITHRGAASSEYAFSLDGDWTVNEALLQLLSTQFGVDTDVDTLTSIDEIPLDDVRTDVEQTMRDRCREVPEFDIVDKAILGTFLYQKLPMVRDLQDASEQLAEHDLIAAIAGWAKAKEDVRAANGVAETVSVGLPDQTPPADEFLVLDADSSQNHVINKALAGASLVVQGPPGTGKSQTISNLIAASAARGKRILFVAEKRAAIDAVIGRLDDVGLDPLVMDLHGGVGSKRQIAADIKAAYETLDRSTPNKLAGLHTRLEQDRTTLNQHSEALHQPRQPWGLSVVELQQTVLAHRGHGHDAGGYVFPVGKLEQLDEATMRQVVDTAEEWVALTRRIRTGESAWADTTVQTPDDVTTVQQTVADLAGDVVPSARAALDSVVAHTGLDRPDTISGWSQLLAVLTSVAGVLETCQLEVFDEDLGQLADDLQPAAGSWWSRMIAQLFNSDYRAAKATVRAHSRSSDKANGPACLQAVTDATDAIDQWQQAGGDGRPDLPADADELFDGHQRLTTYLTALGAFVVGNDLRDSTVDHLEGDLHARLVDQQTLIQMPTIYTDRRFLEQLGFASLLRAVEDGTVDDGTVGGRLWHDWATNIITRVSAADPVLSSFDGQRLHKRVDDFRQHDVDHVATTAARVRRAVAKRAAAVRNDHRDQDELLAKEAGKKTRHLPVRELFSRTIDVLTAVKPVWTMSPLSVAQVLPATQMFDLVIFDEASQITPEDAISALLRADQAVVAGDRLQLPPTSFFSKDVEDDDADDEEMMTTGFESILDVLGAMLPSTMLTWHYRSADERLISFSNAHVYDGSLTTFPGVGDPDVIRHELVFEDGGPRVGTKSRAAEVHRVVDLLIDHARSRPTESAGVIAFGSDHGNRIEAALHERLGQERDPDLDDFFDPAAEERVFVKNIERVQGDERDAIFLTVGYCRNTAGTLPYRFGPLNQEGGERRLNVAVTRARRRLTLVSSISHIDMEPGRSSKRGVELLRAYLKYADSGGHDLRHHDGETPLNAFEHDVKYRLEQAGLTVHPQVGASGYRIDFAVTDPAVPGRYLLAVEADGATYHSSPTARDRDRLRQQVLERLGWRFHRIWSTDWFYDPETETIRVVEAAEAAKSDHLAGRTHTAPEVAPREEVVAATADTPQKRSGTRPNLPRNPSSINAYSASQLRQLANWIRSDGRLRTDEQLVDAMFDELPFKRCGSRIRAALENAVQGTSR